MRNTAMGGFPRRITAGSDTEHSPEVTHTSPNHLVTGFPVQSPFHGGISVPATSRTVMEHIGNPETTAAGIWE